MDDLIIVEVDQRLKHNSLNVLQEVEFELVQPHHIRRDPVQFSLLVSLYSDHPIFTNQIPKRFWITRSEQLPFVLYYESIKARIGRYYGPFTE